MYFNNLVSRRPFYKLPKSFNFFASLSGLPDRIINFLLTAKYLNAEALRVKLSSNKRIVGDDASRERIGRLRVKRYCCSMEVFVFIQ